MDISDDKIMKHKDSSIDPESFRGQVYLILIDKLIIGIAAGLAVFFLQGWFEDFQKAKYQEYEVSQVSAKIITEQRSNFTKSIQNYLLFLIQNRSKRTLPDSEINALNNLTEKIRISVLTASAIEPQIDKDAEKLVSIISETNQILLEGGDGITEGDLNSIKTEYRNTLASFRRASINAIRKDRQ
jgi:hypothetical protein